MWMDPAWAWGLMRLTHKVAVQADQGIQGARAARGNTALALPALSAGAHRIGPFVAAGAAVAAAAAEGPAAGQGPGGDLAFISAACPRCRRCSADPSSLRPEATPAAAGARCGAMAPAERPEVLRPRPPPPALLARGSAAA